MCDPNNPNYGKVEVISADPKTGALSTAEWNFSAGVSPDHRVETNPQKCLGCHSATSVNDEPRLKYNWPDYPHWTDCKQNRGIQTYGGFDDVIEMPSEGPRRQRQQYMFTDGTGKPGYDCTAEEDRAAMEREIRDFQKFRSVQKENPCFSTLPWPKEDDKVRGADVYPYSGSGALRSPNFKLGLNFARWTGRRIAGDLKKDPAYNYLK